MAEQLNYLNPHNAQRLYEILVSADLYITLEKVSKLKVSIRSSDEIIKELNHQAQLHYDDEGYESKSSHRKAKSIQYLIDVFSDALLELDNIEDALTLSQVVIDETKLNKQNFSAAVLFIACILNFQLSYIRLGG